MKEAIRDHTANLQPSGSKAKNWRFGWKRRVLAWGCSFAVSGLIVGSNINLQHLLGVGSVLSIVGLFGGYFLGVLFGFGIEAIRAWP